MGKMRVFFQCMTKESILRHKTHQIVAPNAKRIARNLDYSIRRSFIQTEQSVWASKPLNSNHSNLDRTTI